MLEQPTPSLPPIVAAIVRALRDLRGEAREEQLLLRTNLLLPPAQRLHARQLLNRLDHWSDLFVRAGAGSWRLAEGVGVELAAATALPQLQSASIAHQEVALIRPSRIERTVATDGRLSSPFFTTGAIYTRAELRERFSITDMTLQTGVFPFRGYDSVWLFVTEEKTLDRTQYRDHLHGDTLDWDGQTSGRTDSLIIQHKQRRVELLLFYRRSKQEFPGAGFRYYGPVEYVHHFGERPAHFVLRLSTAATVQLAATAPLPLQRAAEEAARYTERDSDLLGPGWVAPASRASESQQPKTLEEPTYAPRPPTRMAMVSAQTGIGSVRRSPFLRGVSRPDQMYDVLRACADTSQTQPSLLHRQPLHHEALIASLDLLKATALLDKISLEEPLTVTALGRRVLDVIDRAFTDETGAGLRRGVVIALTLPQYRLAWEISFLRDLALVQAWEAPVAAAERALAALPGLSEMAVRVAGLCSVDTADPIAALVALDGIGRQRTAGQKKTDVVQWVMTPVPGWSSGPQQILKSGFTTLWWSAAPRTLPSIERRQHSWEILQAAGRLPRLIFASRLQPQQLELLLCLLAGAVEEEGCPSTTVEVVRTVKELQAIGLPLRQDDGVVLLSGDVTLVWDLRGVRVQSKFDAIQGLSAALPHAGTSLDGRRLRALLPAASLVGLRPGRDAVCEQAKCAAVMLPGIAPSFGQAGETMHDVVKQGMATRAGAVRLTVAGIAAERGRSWPEAVVRLPQLYVLALVLMDAGAPGAPEIVGEASSTAAWQIGAAHRPLITGLDLCLRRLGFGVETTAYNDEARQRELAQALVDLAVTTGIAERRGTSLGKKAAFDEALQWRDPGYLRGETVALRRRIAEWLNSAGL